MVHPLEDIRENESDDERDRCRDEKVDQRSHADGTDLAHILQRHDAGDHRSHDDRNDDELEQVEEDRADWIQVVLREIRLPGSHEDQTGCDAQTERGEDLKWQGILEFVQHSKPPVDEYDRESLFRPATACAAPASTRRMVRIIANRIPQQVKCCHPVRAARSWNRPASSRGIAVKPTGKKLMKTAHSVMILLA